MSYEVTATRRRPQKFEDLVGQEFVAETFRNAIQSKKSHMLIFFQVQEVVVKLLLRVFLQRPLTVQKVQRLLPVENASSVWKLQREPAQTLSKSTVRQTLL